MAGALTMRVDVEGFDPIELEIARQVVKSLVAIEMAGEAKKYRVIGRAVAEAVGAYRRAIEWDEATRAKP